MLWNPKGRVQGSPFMQERGVVVWTWQGEPRTGDNWCDIWRHGQPEDALKSWRPGQGWDSRTALSSYFCPWYESLKSARRWQHRFPDSGPCGAGLPAEAWFTSLFQGCLLCPMQKTQPRAAGFPSSFPKRNPFPQSAFFLRFSDWL